MEVLVGSTGFVGGNLLRKHSFDVSVHSMDVSRAYGTRPDLLVYAGVRAEMFIANKYPDEDYKHIQNTIRNIELIAPKEMILISTISTMGMNARGDEHAYINKDCLSPYGRHRLILEEWVNSNIKNSRIIRLPALFGKGIKKNVIFDYLKFIPRLLSCEKYRELSNESELIETCYLGRKDGYYEYTGEKDDILKAELRRIGFSALSFTDSRSIYQFYPLERLWDDIGIVRYNDLRIINLATEPMTVRWLIKELSGEDFFNELSSPPVVTDIRTHYYPLFKGRKGYILEKKSVMDMIRSFVEVYE